MSKKVKRILSIVAIILCVSLVSSIPAEALSGLSNSSEDATYSNFNDIKGDNEEIGNIVYENKSTRTEYTKEFVLDNGTTLLAQYNQPVHYKDSDGKWVDYDNSLAGEKASSINNESDSSNYINKSSNIKIKLSQKAKSNNMISLSSNDYNISWGYDNANKSKAIIKNNNEKLSGNEKFTTLNNLTSEAVYKDVFNSVDLQYFVSSSGVKENIILKSSTAQNEFELTYKINNLSAKQKDDYTIVLSDKKGNEVYAISAPYMYDADGNMSTQLKLEMISQKGANLKIKLTADYWFIHGLGRSFPITIDPELTNQLTASQTTFYQAVGQSIQKNNPNYIDDKDAIIIIANSLPTFGNGDKIVSATYNFAVANGESLFESGAEKPIKINAHKLETAYHGSYSYDSNILDYDTLTYGDSNEFSFDLTKAMKEWYHNGNTIDGFFLEAFDTVTSKKVILEEYTNTVVAPSLSIIYKNYVGTEPDLTYNTISVGENAESNVCYYTGSLNIKQSIYEGTGSRMPVHITATYNSTLNDKLFANGSPAGYGWQFSFNQYIQECSSDLKAAGYDYVYTDEDGTEHYFKKDGSEAAEKWTDEDDLGLTLTSDDNYLYITNNSDIIQKYNLPSKNGTLLSETDEYGNAVTYTYNSKGNLIKITDGAGRIISINYANYSTSTEARVYSITLPDGNSIKFIYYAADQLVAGLSFPNGNVTRYYYNDYTPEGLINCVDLDDATGDEVIHGKRVIYTYNNNSQVQKITEYGGDRSEGNCLQFEYNDDNTTKISDKKGRSETYTFDNYGNTVSVLNANGYIENTKSSESSGFSLSNGSESYTRNYVEESREPSSKYFSKVNGEGSVGGQLSYDSSTEPVNGEKVQYLGSKSIKITNTGETQFYTMAKHQYDDSNLFGKTLTLSSYVKTKDVVANDNADDALGALLKIECFDVTGNMIKEDYSPGLTGNNNWQRISASTKIPANTDYFNIYCGVINAQGTAWFDCLQLEESEVMNDYNALQNSDFSTDDAWNNPSANNINQIEGDGASDRFVYQYVNINKSNVAFNISAQAKADSVPLSEEKRTFGIALKIFYEGDTANSNIETHYQPFNSATNAFHSVAATITPEKPNQVIKTVAFAFVYQYNENVMTLKNAMLNICDIPFDDSVSDETNGIALTDSDTDSDEDESEEITYPYDGSVSTYDSYGNVLTTKQGSVIKDSNGEEVIDTSKPYISTSSTYDATGNYVTSDVDASGNSVSYTVDAVTGNITEAADGNGNTINYTYNSSGNVANVANGSSSNDYAYNSAGQLSVISHNGFSYKFNYDVYNNLVSTTIGDTAIVSNTYDKNNGNLTMTKYGNGQGFKYSYDEYDRITKIVSIANDPLVNYRYNKKGLVTKSISLKSNQTTEYQYDCTGNLLRKTVTSIDGNKIIHSSGYDASGKPVETLDINGKTRTITTGTDENGSSYIDNGGSKIITITDSLDRKESIKQLDNSSKKTFETSFEYAPGAESGSTTELVSRYSQSYDGKTLANYDYTYDSNGNITTIKENGKLIAKYTYDSLNQLKTEYDYVNKKYVVYSYDGNGNILAQHTQRLDPTYGYPSGRDYGNVFYYKNSEWKDKLTGINGETITYDEIGNPLSYRDGMKMKWQAGRELSRITLSDGTAVSFEYDINGLRTCKNVDGTKTYYYYDDSNNLVGLSNESATMFFYYDSDNSPVSFSYNGTMYYYVKNLQGDIVGIIDKNGTSFVTYVYDSWGNISGAYGEPVLRELNPIRYRGYVYDSETGLYYLQSRYYDPVTGRFINADAYCDTQSGSPLSTNMFAYCENNPINCVDTSGKFLLTLSAAGLFYLTVALTVSLTAITVVSTPSFKQGWSNLCNSIGSGLSKALEGLGNSINWISSKAKDIVKDISKSFSKIKSKPKYKKSTEVHHIVAKGSKKAKEAQKVLLNVGINYKNDTRNLITIKTGLHRRLHTNKYYEFVNTLVINAYNRGKNKSQKKSNVIRVLSNLKKIINSMNAMSPF